MRERTSRSRWLQVTFVKSIPSGKYAPTMLMLPGGVTLRKGSNERIVRRNPRVSFRSSDHFGSSSCFPGSSFSFRMRLKSIVIPSQIRFHARFSDSSQVFRGATWHFAPGNAIIGLDGSAAIGVARGPAEAAANRMLDEMTGMIGGVATIVFLASLAHAAAVRGERSSSKHIGSGVS